MQQAEEAKLLSSEHFSVDGTLIRAWASLKSFVPKDGPPPNKTGSKNNPEVEFKGQKRSNDTHPLPPTRIPGCSPSRRKPRLCHPSWAMC